MSFHHPIQVPYYQIDQQGVAFNMWYLGWFDDAMTAFLDAAGYPYGAMVSAGCDVQLVHTELDWTGSVRFGDPVRIGVAVEAMGTTSFTLSFAVRLGVGAEPVASGRTVYVVVAADGSGKRPIPSGLRAALSGTERDETAPRIR
jgi:acyl-CoA thioester hydrolase